MNQLIIHVKDKDKKTSLEKDVIIIKKKKGKPYAQKLIPIVIFAVTIYAIANILLQIFYQVEISPTLTTCWFTFWGVEIINLAVIKVGKKVRDPNSFGTLEMESLESVEEENSL